MENVLDKLKALRKQRIEEKNESSSSGGGGNKPNFTAGGQPLDFEHGAKDSLAKLVG